MMEGGKCHICRQWPHEQDDNYDVPTCIDCPKSEPYRTGNGMFALGAFCAILTLVVAFFVDYWGL